MRKLSTPRALGIIAIVAGAFAVALLLGAVFGSLGLWEVALMLGAAIVGAGVVLLVVRALQSASSGDSSAG